MLNTKAFVGLVVTLAVAPWLLAACASPTPTPTPTATPRPTLDERAERTLTVWRGTPTPEPLQSPNPDELTNYGFWQATFSLSPSHNALPKMEKLIESPILGSPAWEAELQASVQEFTANWFNGRGLAPPVMRAGSHGTFVEALEEYARGALIVFAWLRFDGDEQTFEGAVSEAREHWARGEALVELAKGQAAREP